MKKIILLATLILALGTGHRAMAQVQIDCDEAVVARYDFNYAVLEILDEVKYNYICAESKVAFEFVDVLPADAYVVQLSDLRERHNNNTVDDSYDDQSLCSYYRFNYGQLQAQRRGDLDMFVQLPAGRKHAYLLVHPYRYITEHAQLLIENMSNDK